MLRLQAAAAASLKHMRPPFAAGTEQHASNANAGLGPPTRYPGGGPGLPAVTVSHFVPCANQA